MLKEVNNLEFKIMVRFHRNEYNWLTNKTNNVLQIFPLQKFFIIIILNFQILFLHAFALELLVILKIIRQNICRSF